MTYTSHGHHIPNSIMTAERPEKVARCGGPNICPKCALDVVHFLSANGKLNLGDTPTPKTEIEGLKVEKYTRNSFDVDAVQVTEENMALLADWCGGSIIKVQETQEDALVDLPPKRYISVPVVRPLSTRQTQAYVGDWVLWADKGFKVYGQKPFSKSFSKSNPDQLVELLTTAESV